MTIQVFSAAPHTTGRAVFRVIRRSALAAMVAGLGAIAINAYGADLETGYSRAVAAPPRSAPAVRWSTPAHPINTSDTGADRPVQRAVLVDQLYDHLMRTSGCVLASSKASIRGGC
jgi:hypothetical protein